MARRFLLDTDIGTDVDDALALAVRTHVPILISQEVMEAAGMRIVGQFVSADDPDAFFYLRSFADTDERDRQYAAVYGSNLWKTTLAPYALALETDARIEVVTPTAGSALR